MYNILIVEDDKIQRDGLCNIIKSVYNKPRITPASTYDEAHSYIKHVEYDLFILDIELVDAQNTEAAAETANQNGISLAFEIRNISRYKHTPIIFITAFPSQIFSAVNDLHCYSFIVKPYEESAVIRALENVQETPMFKEIPLEFKDVNGIYFRVSIRDIIYVKLRSHTYTFYTTHGHYELSTYMLNKHGTAVFSRLIRCHKSYYFNFDYLKYYDKSSQFITLRNVDMSLPIGRQYKDSVEYEIEELLHGRNNN